MKWRADLRKARQSSNPRYLTARKYKNLIKSAFHSIRNGARNEMESGFKKSTSKVQTHVI